MNLPKSNGTIVFTRTFGPADGADTITAEWRGGSVVHISGELMQLHDRRFWERIGNELAVCQYKLIILGKTPAGDYVAQRIFE